MRKIQSKEYTKLAKTLEVPFKTPEFANDGIATIWQGLRDKATQLATFHQEQAGLVKAGTITELTRLREDIKKHLKDLDKEGVQGSKKVGKKMDKFVTPPPLPFPQTLFLGILESTDCRVILHSRWASGFQLRRRIQRVWTMITIHMSSTVKFVINCTVQSMKKINSTNNFYPYKLVVNNTKQSLSKQFKKQSKTTPTKSPKNHNTPPPSPTKLMVPLPLQPPFLCRC